MLLLYTRGILSLFKAGKLKNYRSLINQEEAEKPLENSSAFSDKIRKEIDLTQQEYFLERRFIL